MEFLLSLIHGLTGASVISDTQPDEFATCSGNRKRYALSNSHKANTGIYGKYPFYEQVPLTFIWFSLSIPVN